jgi:hypothetical protein
MSYHIDDPNKWAEIIQNLPQLMPENTRHIFGCDAALAVAKLTRNVILCGSPTELFSNKRPAFIPKGSDDDGLFPIDVLYGHYCPETKVIEIFIENIRNDATLFGTFDDLLHIVRIHEHAHAIVHLGINEGFLLATLENLGSDGLTDWNPFTDLRTSIFRHINGPTHELIAQAITYAVALQHPVLEIANRLTRTYLELEKRQPEYYVLPQEIKEAAKSICWPMLLDAARGYPEIPLGPEFSLQSGLRELAVRMHKSEPSPPLPNSIWCVEFKDVPAISDLRSALADLDMPVKSKLENSFELLVDRFAGLKIELFSREHPPPHFRVICGGEAANYRISDCFKLNGELNREYRIIRDWHSENKDKLIEAWNKLRPSNCPVGEYQEY